MKTANLNLPFLIPFQTNKDIAVNENFIILDAICGGSLISLNPFSQLPSGLNEGDMFIIGVSDSPELSDKIGNIAIYTNNGLRFIIPKNGLTLFNKQTNKHVEFINNTWVNLVSQEQDNSSSYFIGDYKQSAQNANHGSWLLCNGQLVSRSIYPALFNIIGISFGRGDGSTTFNLPDFRGRIFGSIGQGNGLTSRVLGNVVGSETHTLAISEIPSHSHELWHAAQLDQFQGFPGGGFNAVWSTDRRRATGANAMQPVGSNQPHNNMQPTIFAGNTFIFSGISI